MLDKLISGMCWVCIIFPDMTVITIQTTLNKQILKQSGVEMRSDCFFDFNKGQYVPFRKDAAFIEVFDEKPEFESEVLQFASRFI